MMPSLHVLLIGDMSRAEFRRARATLESLATVAVEPDIAAATRVVEDGQLLPDTIVVAQAYPGQFAAEQVARLRRAAPCTPIVALLGSWCEGEMRSGRPWPGVVRVYWHQWEARAAQELSLLAAGHCSAWSLPATATEEDRLLASAGRRELTPCRSTVEEAQAQHQPESPARDGPSLALRACDDEPQQTRGLMVIATPEPAQAEWLTEACRRQGYATVWLRPPYQAEIHGATAAIFDGDDCHGAEAAQLREFCRRLAPAPVVTLMTFPRADDVDRALSCGAAVVLSKPLHLLDLFWQLERLGEPACRL
jgi:hypothetical protein